MRQHLRDHANEALTASTRHCLQNPLRRSEDRKFFVAWYIDMAGSVRVTQMCRAAPTPASMAWRCDGEGQVLNMATARVESCENHRKGVLWCRRMSTQAAC
jgi:hypothetical protein